MQQKFNITAFLTSFITALYKKQIRINQLIEIKGFTCELGKILFNEDNEFGLGIAEADTNLPEHFRENVIKTLLSAHIGFGDSNEAIFSINRSFQRQLNEGISIDFFESLPNDKLKIMWLKTVSIPSIYSERILGTMFNSKYATTEDKFYILSKLTIAAERKAWLPKNISMNDVVNVVISTWQIMKPKVLHQLRLDNDWRNTPDYDNHFWFLNKIVGLLDSDFEILPRNSRITYDYLDSLDQEIQKLPLVTEKEHLKKLHTEIGMLKNELTHKEEARATLNKEIAALYRRIKDLSKEFN